MTSLDSANRESIMEHVLANQTTLVQKVSELEKSNAVIAVELRMMRELLEQQQDIEERVRALERESDSNRGKSSVHYYVVNVIVALASAVATTVIAGKL